MTKILPPTTNRRLLVSLLLTGLAGNNNIVEAVVPSSQLRRVAGIKEQLPDDNFDRRNLQVDCSSISRRRNCGNTSGCQWAGKNNGGCIAVQTSPPSPEPVSSVWSLYFLLLHHLLFAYLMLLSISIVDARSYTSADCWVDSTAYTGSDRSGKLYLFIVAYFSLSNIDIISTDHLIRLYVSNVANVSAYIASNKQSSHSWVWILFR